jgi:hypothetical protein
MVTGENVGAPAAAGPAGAGAVPRTGTRAAPARRRAIFKLARHELARRFAARASWVLAIAAALMTLALAAAVGPEARLSDVVLRGVYWMAWLAWTPLVLSATAPVQRRDADALAALVVQHGGGLRELAWFRALAFLWACTARVAIPASLVALALLSGRALASQLAGVWTFAILASALLSALVLACRHWGGERARTLLVLAMVVPWAWVRIGGAGYSIPDALSEALDLLVSVEIGPGAP